MIGLNVRYHEQIAYFFNLPDNIGLKYEVGRKNQPPRITDPSPFNDAILISIRWAPNPLVNQTSFLEDTLGENRDLLWKSGPVIDPEGDRIFFKVNLTFIFTCELTDDKRV